MGIYLFDQYSLLHFAVGVIAYFWNISFNLTIILHIIFEIIENTNDGMNIINKYLTIWPGGKPFADSKINSIGDTILTAIGWLCAYYLDQMGIKYGLYPPHLKN